MSIKRTSLMNLVARLNALTRAELKAKNPEFKKLWKEKRIALLAKDKNIRLQK